MKYTTNEIREAVIAELKDRFIHTTANDHIRFFVKDILDAAFKRLPDRLPDDTKTMDDRLSTDVSGSLCCQCGLRKKVILDKCISCSHGWTKKQHND